MEAGPTPVALVGAGVVGAPPVAMKAYDSRCARLRGAAAPGGRARLGWALLEGAARQPSGLVARYITESRRMHQASAHFLQALEDEPGLDLDVKRRILASTVQLVKDICEKRETVDWATGVTTRREDPIHHYEWVSIMRPPWTPETNMEPAK